MRILGKIISWVLIGGFLTILLAFTALFFWNNLLFLVSPSVFPWNLIIAGAIALLFFISWKRSR